MGKFAIPQWDSNVVGDEICNNLFKGKSKGKSKRKEKLKNGGKIIKAKLNKAKVQMNKKLIKNVEEHLGNVKNLVSKKINKINKHIQPEKEHDAPNTSMNSSQKKLIKKRKKQSTKLKNLPNVKHLKNMLKTQLSNGEDDQKMLFSEDGNQTISENSTTTAELKNKIKKKKLKHLKKDITEKVKSEVLEVKNKRKQKRKKSQLKVSDDKTNEESCSLNNTLNSNSGDDSILTKKSGKKDKKDLSLRERMLGKLKASRFRYLNEQLYCSPSKDAQNLFKNDPDSFKAYHEGFRQQVDRWPVNPVDIIIKSIKKMNKNYVIADFGCGDAKIAQQVKQKVHSFDLAAVNERVTTCDMANVPLAKESVDVAVFCLSLMGTNLQDYLKEANRVLKMGGILKIAEVESRFEDADEFIKGVQHFGFQNIHKDLSHNIFYFMDFKKKANTKKTKGLPTLSLNPCLYKKR